MPEFFQTEVLLQYRVAKSQFADCLPLRWFQLCIAATGAFLAALYVAGLTGGKILG